MQKKEKKNQRSDRPTTGLKTHITAGRQGQVAEEEDNCMWAVKEETEDARVEEEDGENSGRVQREKKRLTA